VKPLALAIVLLVDAACSAVNAARFANEAHADDFTILTKSHCAGAPAARSGYYVTIVDGVERDTEIDGLCYQRVAVGMILPPDCG
jgi:hypothetical protein